jgi:CRP/FNR family transcriptional regulator, polysaccharide utilization system transcription regulator
MKQISLLSQTVQAELLAKATLRTEPKGAVLFRRGEPSLGIFLVRKGRISLRLESREGKTILDRTVMRDAIVGLPSTLSGGRYSLTAVALEESDVAFVESQALIELMRSDPGIGLEVVHALGEEVVRMRQILASTPVVTVPQPEQSGNSIGTKLM